MVQARDRLGQLGLAVALDAGHGDDFACAYRERDVVDHSHAALVCERKVVQLEHGLAGVGLTFVDNQLDGAADHHRGELGLAGLPRCCLPDHLAEAHDRDAVGYGEDLFQLVGDEQDRAPRLGKRTDDPEKPLGFLRGEHGGGFVEDQYLSVAHQGLDDLDPLLGTDGDVLDEGVGVHFEAELARQPAGCRRGPCGGRGTPGAGSVRSRERCSLPP